jgi:hypothetical protein
MRRRDLLFALPLALAAMPLLAADPPVKSFRGQVVCSGCWDEEPDRKKSPYGTAEDLSCAARCEKRGVAAALAVEQGTSFTLYELAPGAFTTKSWLPYMGKVVELKGRTPAGGKPRILVDAVTVIEKK